MQLLEDQVSCGAVQLLAPAPDVSMITVWVRTEGLLARGGQELVLAASGWRGSASIDGRRFTVEVAVPARGLRAQGEAREGRVLPLDEGERRELEQTLIGPHVLDAARHAEVRWAGQGTLPDGGRGEARAEGQLTLRGTTRPLPLEARIDEQDGAGGDGAPPGRVVVVTGEVGLTQSAHGLRPYSAFLGALRVKDEVRVSWRVVYRRLSSASTSR